MGGFPDMWSFVEDFGGLGAVTNVDSGGDLVECFVSREGKGLLEAGKISEVEAGGLCSV